MVALLTIVMTVGLGITTPDAHVDVHAIAITSPCYIDTAVISDITLIGARRVNFRNVTTPASVLLKVSRWNAEWG